MTPSTEELLADLRALVPGEKAKIAAHIWRDDEFRSAIAIIQILEKELTRQPETRHPLATVASVSPFQNPTGELTSKELGKRIRLQYISDLAMQGVQLSITDNVWARTQKGLWTGIPFAAERRKGRWFLGLPKRIAQQRIQNGGASIILLCQSGSKILDFVLPPHTVTALVSQLSESEGQLKFNVKETGSRYYLAIPPRSSLEITNFLHDTSILVQV